MYTQELTQNIKLGGAKHVTLEGEGGILFWNGYFDFNRIMREITISMLFSKKENGF